MPRKKRSEGVACGVDLGNATTLVAHPEEGGRCTIIRDPDGLEQTPTMIAWPKGQRDQPVFGRAAVSCMAMTPEYCCEYGKSVRGDHDVVAAVLADGSTVTTGEGETQLLRWRLDCAESFLGAKVHSVVLAVPANFTDEQRRATQRIAEAAGVEVLGIINEPTAALLAYGSRKTGTFAVADLGGGTFDVSIVKVEKTRNYAVLTTTGEDQLGGRHFTQNLVNHFLGSLKERGVDLDPSKDLRTLCHIRDECERAKQDLSSMESTYVTIRAGNELLDEELTRATFEALNAQLLERIVQIAKTALDQSGLTPEDLRGLVLVGGASRMPCFREAMAGLFGQDKLLMDVNPSTAVAEGTALAVSVKIQEQIAAGNKDVVQDLPDYLLTPDIQLVDILGHAVGIRALHKGSGEFRLAPIIEANEKLPCKGSRTFGLQPSEAACPFNTAITVLEGKSGCLADEARELASFTFTDLPPGPTDDRISVDFDVDANGLIHVRAVDLASKKELTGKADARSAVSSNSAA